MLISTDRFDPLEVIKFGKGLVLSQYYEKQCKYIIRMFLLTEKLSGEEFSFLSTEHLEFTEALSKTSLGRHIGKLAGNEQRFGISSTEYLILEDAKESRNWIAHDCCMDSIAESVTNGIRLSGSENKFEEHIAKIAAGIALVEEIVLAIEEPELGVPSVDAVEEAIRWVGQA